MSEQSTLSSLSFQSAYSDEQDMVLLSEGMTPGTSISSLNLVQLLPQTRKPITESPLLMRAYTTHLSRTTASAWGPFYPQFHQRDVPKYSGDSSGILLISTAPEVWTESVPFLPKFFPTDAGFTALTLRRLKAGKERNSPDVSPSHFHNLRLFEWKEKRERESFSSLFYLFVVKNKSFSEDMALV